MSYTFLYSDHMDPNADFSARRDSVYRELTDLLLSALEKAAIKADDAEDASQFILERLDDISSEAHLSSFLSEISSRWPVFSPILISQQTETSNLDDKARISEVENEIKSISNQN